MADEKFIGYNILKHLLVLLHTEINKAPRLTTTINNTSTDEYVASARAVYEFVTEVLGDITDIQFRVVTDLPEEGDLGTFYLIRISDDPETYKMFIYVDDDWRPIGQAEIDLSDYWAKDELVPMTIAELDEIFYEVFHEEEDESEPDVMPIA